MKIQLARTLGYCLGVRRAMDLAFSRLSRRSGRVYSHGELIHNGPALELLARKGLGRWAGEGADAIIIRAHGLPPAELEALSATGLEIEDATCPRVRRVQKLVAREAGRGRMVIIWGQASHPEVVGLLGHAGDRGRVAAGPEELPGLPEPESRGVLLVAQTTQDRSRWPEMAAAVRARWPDAHVKNTICEATETRQAEVRRLAGETDALVIVGGRTSGNTARLADIGRRAGLPTQLVESAADLDPAALAGAKSVGLAAGASTSLWQIAQVLQALQALARSRRGVGSFGPRLLRALVLGGIFAALGPAALAVAAGALLGGSPPPVLFSFFFFQAASLRLFAIFSQSRSRSQALALQVSDPERTAFFAKYNLPLKMLGLTAALLAGLAAVLAGSRAVLALGLTWLAALAYQFLPRPRGRPNLPRTLAGPMLWAGGWAALLVWVNLSPPTAIRPALFTGGAVFGHLFVLTLLGDVLGVQGDRIFGRPTLPTVFGERAARRLVTIFLGFWALGLAAGAAGGHLPSLAWLLIAPGPLYHYFFLGPLFPDPARDDLSPSLHGIRFEALRHLPLALAGLAAWLWTVLAIP